LELVPGTQIQQSANILVKEFWPFSSSDAKRETPQKFTFTCNDLILNLLPYPVGKSRKSSL